MANHSLFLLLEHIEKHKNDNPVVTFDLDSTLFCNSGRTLKIFADCAKKRPEYSMLVKKIYPRAMQWSIDADFVDAGVDEEFLKTYRDTWWYRFFSNEIIEYDRPHPGAARFVNRVLAAGAKIFFVSGRDEPRMGDGTRKSLQDWGFCTDRDRTTLILKQDKDQADEDFKNEALKQISKAGTPVAFIDDLPKIANLFHERFPEAMIVLMDVPHPADSPEPDPSFLQTKDFILPKEQNGPYLVVMSGLPATGKSTVAKIISGTVGGVHLSTDRIRKDLYPQHLPREVKYSDEAKRKVYKAMYEGTEQALASGQSAVMDGTFLRNTRAGLFEIAQKHCAKLLFVKTTCSDKEIHRRMEWRKTHNDNFSEAHENIYKEMKEKMASDKKRYLDVTDDPLVTEAGTPLLIFDTGEDTYRAINVENESVLMEKVLVDFPLYLRID